jgi:putative membrane protein
MTPADWGLPFMWFPMFPILFIVLGLVFCFFMMSMMMGRHAPWRRWRDDASTRSLDILNERYAKGDIDKSEYDEKRRTILQGG